MTERRHMTCPLQANALARPRQTALRTDEMTLTWRQLDGAVAAQCTELRRAGLRPEDTVAVLAANSLDFAILFFAVIRMGAVLAPLNLRRGEAFWRECLTRLEPTLLCVDEGHRRFSALSGHRILVLGASGAGHEATATDTELRLSLDKVATILFTSGSGGQPKGVPLTLGNHISNAVASNDNLPLDEHDCWLADLPFFHVGGLAILVRSALAGSSVHIRQRFDGGAVNALAAAGEISILSCVPQMLAFLLDDKSRARALAGLRAILLGGGRIGNELLKTCRELELTVLPTYGMTEAASQICTMAPGEIGDATGLSARPLRGIELRILDEHGSEQPAGHSGEIVIRGPQVFAGYLDADSEGNPDADGWFRTGDLGYLDDEGRMNVIGRRDETFVSGGENIHPTDIENVVRRHEAITGCAVIAVPIRQWGMRPVLFVTGPDLDLIQLRNWLGARLPKLLVPKETILQDSLPTLVLGKIDRQALLKIYMAGQAGQEDDSPGKSRS